MALCLVLLLLYSRSPVCSPENVPVRNSEVDYRLLEAAKAGDLDTVKVSQSRPEHGQCGEAKVRRMYPGSSRRAAEIGRASCRERV